MAVMRFALDRTKARKASFSNEVSVYSVWFTSSFRKRSVPFSGNIVTGPLICITRYPVDPFVNRNLPAKYADRINFTPPDRKSNDTIDHTRSHNWKRTISWLIPPINYTARPRTEIVSFLLLFPNYPFLKCSVPLLSHRWRCYYVFRNKIINPFRATHAVFKLLVIRN